MYPKCTLCIRNPCYFIVPRDPVHLKPSGAKRSEAKNITRRGKYLLRYSRQPITVYEIVILPVTISQSR